MSGRDNDIWAFPRALPNVMVPPDEAAQIVAAHAGMTLRDYAAVHSTQPGMSELCKVAGVAFDHGGYKVKNEGGGWMRFDDWWNSLPLETQCLLAAKVRYAQADAMLKARQA